MQGFRTVRHVDSSLRVILVFVTKSRSEVFDQSALDFLKSVFTDVCTDFDVGLVSFEGGGDFIRVEVAYPPQVAVSNLVNSLKGVSSRLLKKQRVDLLGRFVEGGLWSPSYFVGSIGEGDVIGRSNVFLASI
jgi:putative transposase